MKIGKNRIAVLIGKDGDIKKEIEDKLGVKINLDSKSGNCEILPQPENPKYMPLNVITAEKIVNAINRGFNPIKAMKLLDENFDFVPINLISILGKSDKRIKRVKGRIIGRNGEMRKAIEKYDNRISIPEFGLSVSYRPDIAVILQYNIYVIPQDVRIVENLVALFI